MENRVIGEFEVLPKKNSDQWLSFVLIVLMWVAIGASMGWLTGCAVMGSDFVMAGNEKGIRAFTDMQTGLAVSATKPEQHYGLRRLQETESTARHMKPSLFEGLFSKRAK